MTQVFLAYTHSDVTCAEQIEQGLEYQGYSVYQNMRNMGVLSPSHTRRIHKGIRGSAALIVIWSVDAAQSECVESAVAAAHHLKKPVVAVIMAGAKFPTAEVGVHLVHSQPPCSDAIALIKPYLPQADSEDPLIELQAQLSHEHIRERKVGIARAADILSADDYHEEVLAMLQDIEEYDEIESVREAARIALHGKAGRLAQATLTDDARHLVPVKCVHGHEQTLDKRRVCPHGTVIRRDATEQDRTALSEIYFKCEKCGAGTVVTIDCEGYK